MIDEVLFVLKEFGISRGDTKVAVKFYRIVFGKGRVVIAGGLL